MTISSSPTGKPPAVVDGGRNSSAPGALFRRADHAPEKVQRRRIDPVEIVKDKNGEPNGTFDVCCTPKSMRNGRTLPPFDTPIDPRVFATSQTSFDALSDGGATMSTSSCSTTRIR